jgi:DNA-binding MurR/RpiR family transcriptional regulator
MFQSTSATWLTSLMASDAPAPPLSLPQELDVRVADARGRLSGNDERILAFLRDHLDELAFHTAESLAQGTGVSAAAVVRFARRLGFASFRELRDRARQELHSSAGAEAPAARADAATTLARKVRRDIDSLELLPRTLETALSTAAEAIATARTTWFLANRETYGIAVYAQRLMHQVRADVRLVDPSFADALRSIGPEDALVACSFRPYARQTLELIAHARDAGTRRVIVTDGRGHDFLDAADVVLAVPVESPTLLLSFTPAVCVIEALVAQVAMLDADHTHDTLDATARFVADQHLLVDRGRLPRSARKDALRRR